MKDIRQKLFAMFQVEHREHLEGIRSALDALADAAGEERRGHLDEAFRRAHSLKGAALAVDLAIVERLSHRLETLFSRVREDGLELDETLGATIQRVLDAIEDWVASPNDARATELCSGALCGIETVLGMDPAPLEPDPEPAPATVGAPVPAAASAPVETVRVGATTLDKLLRSSGQLSVEGLRQADIGQRLDGLTRAIADVEHDSERARKNAGRVFRGLERHETHQLADAFESIESKLHELSRAARSVVRMQKSSAWGLRILSDQVQQEVREARMVPAATVLEGFPKMVRDLAHDQRKEIHLAVSGLEVQADRLVLQALKDPLMHLLRNAVSHGIEDADERSAQGKPARATIELSVRAASDRLHVSLSDDGRGIDPNKLRAEAVRRGVGTEAEVDALPPEKLVDVILRPGFSTAEQVTDISGRGFGLSVVAETVSRLQGVIKARPRLGQGAAFELSVPLSVSSQRLLLVESRETTFAIPAQGIERLYRVDADEIRTVEGRPTISLDGRTLPVLDLAYLLGWDSAMLGVPEARLPALVLQAGASRAVVVVDGFAGQLDGVIKHLPRLDRIATVAGGVVLPDGSISIVLNPPALLAAFRESSDAPLWSSSGSSVEQAVPTILVVDDSITTRTLEKSILEAHGYRVRVAVDGVEGMEVLRNHQADLVVSDIEMPRMDGFGLLAEMKKDAALADIPVIMVSSLESAEHQERGLALGADAYVVKRKFDQTELLETIRQSL